jgi:hypothetical protein
MSWGLFKRNVIRKTNPNNNPSLDINKVATIWADEYDAAIKRGKDFINLESVQAGNKEIMKNLFRAALLKGLATPPGVNFSLPNEFGNGVKAYWAGAQMNPFPIPLIPAPGSIQNLVVNSNIVTNVGVWPLYPPLKPAKKQEIIVNMFILAAIVHLFSIGGVIQTTSLYPSAPSPIPAPGVIIWTGYLIPPAIPIPNPNFPSADGSELPVIEQVDNNTISEVGPIQEYELPNDSDGSGDSGLGDGINGDDSGLGDGINGDSSFEDMVNSSLGDDINDIGDGNNINKQIEEFKKQLVAIRPDCIKN